MGGRRWERGPPVRPERAARTVLSISRSRRKRNEQFGVRVLRRHDKSPRSGRIENSPALQRWVTSPIEELKPAQRATEVREIKQTHLWEVFGSKGIASEVLNRKRGISKTHAQALADYFHVPADLLI